ncbi:MAG: dihydroflavonol-4-reductase [Chloroflexi bacterium]|nr:MAG: dihydroflavonol-4-reductase [Chloroflexota bacterium]
MKALVTGATGFIGGAVASALLEEGTEVRALMRDGSALNIGDGEVEAVTGDILDAASVERAVKGCDVVFHVAALYSLWVKPKVIRQVNVEGTRNVLKAAMDEGVERVVHTSSVAAVAQTNGRDVADETWLPEPKHLSGPYKRSKWEAEGVARDFHQQGLDVVIVNPSFPIGEGDVKPTPTGKVIVDFLSGRLPAYVDTGINVVDVEDVAQGHVLAWKKGRSGERYILGNQNMTLKAALEQLAKIAGMRPPKFKIPIPVALAMSYLDTWIEGYLLRRTPEIPLEGVKAARKYAYVDSSKAINELGLPQTSVEEAFKKAVAWFASHGHVENLPWLENRSVTQML